jgi:hypothetical protein
MIPSPKPQLSNYDTIFLKKKKKKKGNHDTTHNFKENKKKAHNSLDHTDLIRCLPKKKNLIRLKEHGHSLTRTQIYYFEATSEHKFIYLFF